MSNGGPSGPARTSEEIQAAVDAAEFGFDATHKTKDGQVFGLSITEEKIQRRTYFYGEWQCMYYGAKGASSKRCDSRDEALKSGKPSVIHRCSQDSDRDSET